MSKMIETSIQKSIRLQTHTNEIIISMLKEGKTISFTSVAKEAGVSRSFLYSTPALRETINKYRISKLTKAELQKEVINLRYELSKTVK